MTEKSNAYYARVAHTFSAGIECLHCNFNKIWIYAQWIWKQPWILRDKWSLPWRSLMVFLNVLKEKEISCIVKVTMKVIHTRGDKTEREVCMPGDLAADTQVALATLQRRRILVMWLVSRLREYVRSALDCLDWKQKQIIKRDFLWPVISFNFIFYAILFYFCRVNRLIAMSIKLSYQGSIRLARFKADWWESDWCLPRWVDIPSPSGNFW